MFRQSLTRLVSPSLLSSSSVSYAAPRTMMMMMGLPSTHRMVVRSMAMTNEQIRLVKATAPVFQEHGKTITTHFYKRMLSNHPELKNVFNMAHQETGAQPTALANAVFAYAANIDNLGALGKAVSLIAHKHASLQISPSQYPIVGENLLASVKEVLGDAVDQPTIDAWAVAYQQLADILIGAEASLYKQAAETQGGWAGWRPFVVARKEVESDEIISFYLEPADHGKLPTYKPGQFISVKQFVPELGYEQPRQYSLSSAPNEKYLRVSVKREMAAKERPAGKMSNLLHADVKIGMQIDVSPPFGDFYLDLDATTPVVLISGGVGLTPMISMLDTLTQQGAKRKVMFVHAARNKRVHAMRKYLKDVVAKNSSFVSTSIWYEDTSDAIENVDYTNQGRINIEAIADQVVLPGAQYYICGPLAFMQDVEKQLAAKGVAKENMHNEAFGVAA
eukprot:TRINITY_DN10553_c0_g2_i2.p1 TRINITY_DN10553_c0_g2~~TRINITY_DN10553_c0_g2_i2.p1  ORF type:complete len:448 (-),score=108.53 TRINITY_DN10553_c0_g2_i2:24-1367(-)